MYASTLPCARALLDSVRLGQSALHGPCLLQTCRRVRKEDLVTPGVGATLVVQCNRVIVAAGHFCYGDLR